MQNRLTKKEFSSLEHGEQEHFLNSGGIVSDLVSEVPLCASLTVGEQVESSEGASRVASSSDSKVPFSESPSIDSSLATQPALPFPSTDNADGTVTYDGFDIRDPVELLYLLDEDIASGRTRLHRWQISFMMDFASSQHTKDRSFKAEVLACNGSGKDKYVVAACVVWLCMRYRKSRGAVTNGSGVQLDNQTEVHIRSLCQRANSVFGHTIWKCNYRAYTCLITESPITLFATDEPTKAEGFHPLVTGGKMAIFASEAKAIPDDIFTALNRCTGFTHRVDVSSAGQQLGVFYDRCQTAVPRSSIKSFSELSDSDCLLYKIVASDCPHISKGEIETMEKEMPGGKDGAAARSALWSEFGTTSEMVVIPYHFVWRAWHHNIEHIKAEHNTGGLDLSDGGDETVLVVRNGNKHIETIPFRFDNTQDTIRFLIDKFIEHNLNHPDARIYADCGGLGKPMLDQLREKGWTNIRYVDNRSKAYYPKTYLNRGSELWFHLRKLFERDEVILKRDDKLIKQLAGRYYKLVNGTCHQLLSKVEQKRQGYPSPDRADAFTLAFWDYKSAGGFTAQDDKSPDKAPFTQPEPEKLKGVLSLKGWAKGSGSEINNRFNVNGGQKDFSSLESEIADYNSRLQPS